MSATANRVQHSDATIASSVTIDANGFYKYEPTIKDNESWINIVKGDEGWSEVNKDIESWSDLAVLTANWANQPPSGGDWNNV